MYNMISEDLIMTQKIILQGTRPLLRYLALNTPKNYKASLLMTGIRRGLISLQLGNITIEDFKDQILRPLYRLQNGIVFKPEYKHHVNTVLFPLFRILALELDTTRPTSKTIRFRKN